MITAFYANKTDINHDDIVDDDKVMLYVNIPSMSGYRLKVYPRDMKLGEIIESLNASLPTHLKSDRNYLYNHGIRLFDLEQTVRDCGLNNKVWILGLC